MIREKFIQLLLPTHRYAYCDPTRDAVIHNERVRDSMGLPEPLMKQSPKPGFPCLPRLAVAALVVLTVLIGAFA